MRLLSSVRGLLLALVLLGVLPSLAILSWAGDQQRDLLVARVEADALDLARLVAERHQRAVDRARGLLVGVAALPSLRRMDGPSCSAEVGRILRTAPLYANVGATSRDGILFCSAAPSAAVIDLSDRSHVRGALDRGEFSVGSFMTSRTRGFASLGFAHPVHDDAGRVIAAAVASFDLSQLQRDLDELPLPDGADVVVVDKDGVVATARPAARRGTAIDPGFLERLRAGQGVAELDGPDGVRRLYGFVPVVAGAGQVALRVAAGIPAADGWGPVNRVLRQSVSAWLLLALLAVGAALLVGERLVVRRVHAVIAASRRIAAGDDSARTGLPPGRDEIGELVSAFDHMAGSLERLSRQNRLLLDAVGDGVVGLDADGRIIFANPAAARALGWAVDEMLGREAHALFHADAPRDVGAEQDGCCRIRAVMHDAVPRNAEDEVLTRRDGTTFPVEYVASPLLDGAAAVGVVLVFKDVSERRRLQDRLRQVEKMEAIGQLAGGVAHDFNNLLTAIVACNHLVRDGLPADHPALDDVREIDAAAGRAAALTRQLLAFARRQRLEPRPVALRDVVGGVESMLRRLLPATVALEVDAPVAGRVRADPAQLELVVMNLALNARDAMPDGGRIRVRVAEVDAAEARDEALPRGPLSVLSVSDEGTGIAAAARERLFEPFFTTKPPGKGTGLGLATVYGIVAQSGGAVRVRSEPGLGAEFRVYLPRLPAEEGRTTEAVAPLSLAPPPPPVALPAPQPECTSPGDGQRVVLVVEDDAAIRAIARRALVRAGYHVHDAGSAEEALRVQRALSHGVELLVSDVILPGRNGWDLSRELVARVPDLRVLFMSGYAAEASGESLLPAGVPFLAKPFTPGELLERVGAALDGGERAQGAPASAAKRSA